jgi:catechol-2,3-dioxygenase
MEAVMIDRRSLLKYAFLQFKAHLETNGVQVLGVTDHGVFHSIYFFDPNGHRVEIAAPYPDEAVLLEKLDAVKWDMLEEWSRTKRAPAHAPLAHAKELSPR